MNIYSLPPLFTALIALYLGYLVFSKNKKSSVNFTFFLLCLCTFWWQSSWFILFNTKNRVLTYYLVKIGYSGIIFISIAFFHFVVKFLGGGLRKFIIANYLIGFFFLATLWTSKYFISGFYKYFWGFYPKAGILHPFHLFQLFVMTLAMIFLLVRYIKISRPHAVRYNQMKYTLIAIGAYFPAASDYIVNYGIEFYPLGFIFVLFSLSFFAYAIVRHQLMDIEVVIKKSLVFAGMFAFVFGIVVTVTMLIAQLLGGANNLLALAISALIIVFTLRPIETWLINATDKFLFQKKYEYKQIIETFIDKVITVLNLDEIIKSTLKLLNQTLHPYTASIFILNKDEDKYQLYDALGLEDKNAAFAPESELVTFLKKTQHPAVIKQIDGIVGVTPEIASGMNKLKAVIVLPLLLHNDLIGFISLGKKKSDEEYTKDDLDLLQDLARTESIAVGNAQLLTEAAQAERRAAIGTMAAGIHHEIGNPLNIINTKIQLFLVGIKRGLYQGKSKEKIIEICQDILNETIDQTNRIAGITRRLSNFAKPSKEFKPELVNISDEIDESLAVVGHDLELEKLKINKKIAQEALKIRADKHDIQQIFFNIIRNAGQAIEGEGIITIRALSAQDNKVRVEIEDTGKAITEDKAHRIFEPFFSTKGTRGTGLGLSIVRQLVWRNNGEISFRSQVGSGTTFIIEFSRGS